MQTPQSLPEHPFLTAVRLAARVGAPHFYADPEFAEPVVVLPLRQYQVLVEGGVGEEKVPPRSAPPVVTEPDSEALFDPQVVERAIAQGEQEFAKKPANIGSWQPIAERPVASSAEEEGFYLHPVPRKQGFSNR
jgi:hypothetical protein